MRRRVANLAAHRDAVRHRDTELSEIFPGVLCVLLVSVF